MSGGVSVGSDGVVICGTGGVQCYGRQGTDLHKVLVVFVGRELPGESDGLVAAQHSGGEVDHQCGLELGRDVPFIRHRHPRRVGELQRGGGGGPHAGGREVEGAAVFHDEGRLAAGAVQLDGDGRRAGVQDELGDLVKRFDLRRGEANGEEDGGAAGDDALAGENREDSGGVLSDGEEHGSVAVVLEGHLNGYIWREGGVRSGKRERRAGAVCSSRS